MLFKFPFATFSRFGFLNLMARTFSLALLALWGVVRELAAIFLALRGSCGALAHDISRRGHLIFVFDLARATHLAH